MDCEGVGEEDCEGVRGGELRGCEGRWTVRV